MPHGEQGVSRNIGFMVIASNPMGEINNTDMF